LSWTRKTTRKEDRERIYERTEGKQKERNRKERRMKRLKRMKRRRRRRTKEEWQRRRHSKTIFILMISPKGIHLHKMIWNYQPLG